LKNWLGSHAVMETNFNVVSLGPHSRRSRLLFVKALGKDYKVGIIAIENQEYDARQWWASSAGVRTILDESIAYLYARLSS
jgi:hypothetical protein